MQIQKAVREAEEDEKISASTAERESLRAQAQATKEAITPLLEDAASAGKAAKELVQKIPEFFGANPMCVPCKDGDFGRWMACCRDIQKEKLDCIQGWFGACACMTRMGSDNSYCRMVADSLRFCDNEAFWRITTEWGEAGCCAHSMCVDFEGNTWLHLAISMCCEKAHAVGDISIVEHILRWGAPIEAKSMATGKALAKALEYSSVPLVRLLVAWKADRVSGCGPWNPECTPMRLAERTRNPEIISLIRDGLPNPTEKEESEEEEEETPAKKQRMSKDGGNGMQHLSFSELKRSVRKLWEEYTSTLRLRDAVNATWYGEGTASKMNRDCYHAKEVWFREIARQYELNSSDIDTAISAVQTWAAPYFEKGGGGWNGGGAQKKAGATNALRELHRQLGCDSERLTTVYQGIL